MPIKMETEKPKVRETPFRKPMEEVSATST